MDGLTYEVLKRVDGSRGFTPYWPHYADSSIFEGKEVICFNPPEVNTSMINWKNVSGELEYLPYPLVHSEQFANENPIFESFIQEYDQQFDWVLFDQDAALDYNSFTEEDAITWIQEFQILEKCIHALKNGGNAVLRVSPVLLESPKFKAFRQMVIQDFRLKLVQLTDLYHGKFNRTVLWIERSELGATTFYPKPHHKPDFIFTEMKNPHADQWVQIGYNELWSPNFQDKYNKFMASTFKELGCPKLFDLIFEWIEPQYPPADNATIMEEQKEQWIRVLNIQNMYEQTFEPNHKTLQFPYDYVLEHDIRHYKVHEGDVICWIGLPTPRYEQTPVMLWPVMSEPTEPVLLPPHTVVMRLNDVNSEVFQILQRRDIQFYLRNQIRRSGLSLNTIGKIRLPILHPFKDKEN